jgi:hypothetical protein
MGGRWGVEDPLTEFNPLESPRAPDAERGYNRTLADRGASSLQQLCENTIIRKVRQRLEFMPVGRINWVACKYLR